MHIQPEILCAASIPAHYFVIGQLDSISPWNETSYGKDCGDRYSLSSYTFRGGSSGSSLSFPTNYPFSERDLVKGLFSFYWEEWDKIVQLVLWGTVLK